jgi:vitamin B12 transporter
MRNADMMLNRPYGFALYGLSFCLLALRCGWAADSADVRLEDMRVTAAESDERIETAAVFPDPFPLAPGVLFQCQGVSASQTDLHIRGSSFSGAGLSVGGLALRHPQTEHFHAEWPFPGEWFLPPKRLTGLNQIRQSTAHLVGSLDMTFRPAAVRRQVEAGWGERGSHRQRALWQSVRGADGAPVGLGVFALRETARGVDFDDNHLKRHGGGGHVQFIGNAVQADMAAAHQSKIFGARGYYGVNPAWPAEERLDDTLAVVALRDRAAPQARWRGTALWRDTRDGYCLFLPDDIVFENRHRTRVAAAMLEGNRRNENGLGWRWRASLESEHLDSSNLGRHRRDRAEAMAAPAMAWGPIVVFAGLRCRAVSQSQPAWLPLAGVQIDLTERDTIEVSYTENAREPSFTELNYESPGSLGRAGLDTERLEATEIAWTREGRDVSLWKSALFAHRSRNTVDWIKAEPDDPRWTATDLGRVETVGAEILARHAWGRRWVVAAGYTAWHKRNDLDPYAARYVLDYPRHTVQADMTVRLTDALSWHWRQTWRRQAPIPARETAGRRSGFAGRMGLEFSPERARGLRLWLVCDNVWNDAFEPFIGQPVSSRRFAGGLSMDF